MEKLKVKKIQSAAEADEWLKKHEAGMHTEEDDDMIVHCIMYQMSWSPKEPLPTECLPNIRESLNFCAEANDWTIHESSIDTNKISFVVQADPFVSVEQVFNTIRESLALNLVKAYPKLKLNDVWADDAEIGTAGWSDLKQGDKQA